MTKQKELYECLTTFVNKHKITHAESISQVDSIIVDAYDFIEKICDIVGYYEYKEDE